MGGGTGAYGTLEHGGIGIIPELYFGRFISPRFDIKLQGNLGLFRTTIESDGDFANLFLNLRYKLSDETKNFRPYLYAGPGLIADDKSAFINGDKVKIDRVVSLLNENPDYKVSNETEAGRALNRRVEFEFNK